MEKNNYVKDFNVGNPSKENIEYAFKNLLFYISSSINLDTYSQQKGSFENVLKKINNILNIYINSGKLSTIKDETMQDIKYDLIDLDEETKLLNSYYAEWALMWLEALISLKITEKNLGGNQ